MAKTNFNGLLKTAKNWTVKHSPEILTGVGIAGMLSATVLAVKATPKALMAMEDAEYEKGEPLTGVEKVKVAWKPYIPAVVTGIGGAACVVGAQSINAGRHAALATAYQLSTTALADYKEKVIETIGEKKEKGIREKVAQKKIDEAKEATQPQQIIITGMGETLFLDPVSMRAFKSDIQTVRDVINSLNERMIGGEEYISLSDLYDEIGLSHTQTSDQMGWNLGRDGRIKVDFPVGKTDDGQPCLVLDYWVSPRYGFEKLM